MNNAQNESYVAVNYLLEWSLTDAADRRVSVKLYARFKSRLTVSDTPTYHSNYLTDSWLFLDWELVEESRGDQLF